MNKKESYVATNTKKEYTVYCTSLCTSFYLGTQITKNYLDVEYRFNNKSFVTVSIGKTRCNLNFKYLEKATTYYFFEDDVSKAQFLKKVSLDDRSEILRMSPDFHVRKNEKDPKLAIKLKLVDANHCPGSCMFLFWIYEVGTSCVYKPDLYIYTGDYCFTSDLESKLLSLRNSEEVKTVTIVNDNTRESEVDYGVKTDDEALAKMKDFIEFHRKRCKSPIIVKIGADWGMEDLWIRLAREYKTSLYVTKQRYLEICNCMDEDYQKSVGIRPNEKNWKNPSVKMRVGLVFLPDCNE